MDIGGSVSHDDADSSYFSANPGLSYRDDSLAKDSLKRRSYHRFLESQSENTCPVVDLSVDRGCGQVCLGTVAPPMELRPLGVSGVGGACFSSCWMTSTPGRASPEPVTFDPARISAWLGQTPREDPGTRPCSKAVQTDLQCSEGTHCLRDLPGHSQPCHHDAWDPPLALCPTQSCDVKLPSDWMNFNTEPKTQCKHQASRECPGRHPLHHARGQRGVTGEQTTSCPLLWWLLLGMLLALAAWLVVGNAEPDCSRGNTMARSSHLVLRYINGPPPT